MLTTARSYLTSHRDAAEVVKQADKFAIRLPLVGRVAVPPPDQIAFYGVLGGLAAMGVIDWPVAVAIGVGQLVVARHFGGEQPAGEPEPSSKPEPRATAPRKAAPPAKKAPAKKTPAKKTPAKKKPAKKSPAKATDIK